MVALNKSISYIGIYICQLLQQGTDKVQEMYLLIFQFKYLRSMGHLKDYFAFLITSILIIVPYWVLVNKQLITHSQTPTQHCLEINNPSFSLCVSCFEEANKQVSQDQAIVVESKQSFKVLAQQSNGQLQCEQIFNLINYDKKIQTINDVSFQQDEQISTILSQSQIFLNPSAQYFVVSQRVRNLLIVQLRNVNDGSEVQVKKESEAGTKLLRRFISIEAWAAIFTCIIYAILKMVKGNSFQKEIFVNITILVMVLVECVETNNQYLLVYAKSLYIALCLSIIYTPKLIVVILIGIMLLNIPLLNSICLVVTVGIFIYRFIKNPYLIIYLNYLGSCLLILTVNNLLMEYQRQLMVSFPLKLIDYTIICTSTVLVEMLASTVNTKKQKGEVKKGPSLTGFEEITNQDEDF